VLELHTGLCMSLVDTESYKKEHRHAEGRGGLRDTERAYVAIGIDIPESTISQYCLTFICG
jgi:hypothetical protein